MGRCKFGTSCRFAHGETLACPCDIHPHLLGPGIGAAAKRRKAFCDACDEKTKGGWRCTDGCDYLLCEGCFQLHHLPSLHAAGGDAAEVVNAFDSVAESVPTGGSRPERRLHYVTGDATTVPHGRGLKIIAHICNDMGRWGKGFVMAVSAKWPAVAAEYRRWHQSGQDGGFRLGAVQTISITPSMCSSGKAQAALTNASGGLAVANIIGQHGIKTGSGGPPVRYDAISEGLLTVGAQALEMNRVAGVAGRAPSVHMPRIGAGLAGGQWGEIEPLILRMLAASPSLEAYVYDLP
jgi:O-acetyl-ADP-ribose deacetylase (regulator of RNase III)